MNDGTVQPEMMRVTPEVTLFVGGGVLTVALIVVMLVFWVRATRQENEAAKERALAQRNSSHAQGQSEDGA
jgi:flagellar biosynthesis protein FliQ